jgi:crotonobetainyl-CoA:carnitine CoA-transferase CaiB-like acyl-CoA transferase
MDQTIVQLLLHCAAVPVDLLHKLQRRRRQQQQRQRQLRRVVNGEATNTNCMFFCLTRSDDLPHPRRARQPLSRHDIAEILLKVALKDQKFKFKLQKKYTMYQE